MTDCFEPTPVEPCEPICEHRCDDIPRERPHYFSGRLLRARDLHDDQAHLRARLRLRNRLFHGWGVVCGLEVEPHPRPECRDRYVVVHPGIAIDCCGREIFVCEKTTVELPPPPEEEPCPPGEGDHPDQEGRPDDEPASAQPPEAQQVSGAARPTQAGPYEHQKPSEPPPPWGPYVVCLHYVECGIEPGPVLEDPCCGHSRRLAPTRIREGHRLVVVPHHELGEHCWPRGDEEARPCECGDPETPLDCFAPDCPCGDCIPLALLERVPGQLGVHIDASGRPEVVSTLKRLTRIVHINWPHGGTLTPDDIRARRNRLEVCFSRPIAPTGRGTGISRFTFEVTYAGAQRDVEFLPHAAEPCLEDGGCKAVFTIHADCIDGPFSLAHRDIRITLKGDFILDLHGRPIDADHLRGQLPSGNGIAGGSFESWFHLSG